MTANSAWSRRRRLDRALRDAARLHRTGEPGRAEAAYARILADDADHPGALHGLGLLALQAGRADVAIAHIGRAARVAPEHAAYHLDLGLALREQGHIEQARAAFHVAALLDPRDAAPRAAMADMLVRLGRLPEAEEAYRQASTLSPGRADLFRARGLVLTELGLDPSEAFRAASVLAPRDALLRNDLAGALLRRREPAAAERELLVALAIEPRRPDALNNLGLALQDLERPHEALAAFEAAAEVAPEDADIRNNLGVALRDLDRNDDALACFDAALASNADHAPAHLNAAGILLMRGDFARGWEEFEWRDRVPGAAPRAFDAPRWEGDDLAGRTLLVHAEMGFGDTIQFCRFVSRIEGKAVLLVPPPLRRLLAVTDQALPPFDLHCPLLSLPRLLGAAPGSPPYLHADPAPFRDRVAALPGRRVGVCWAGSAEYAQDRRRSLPAAKLAKLAGPGVSLVSLQKGAPGPETVADWTEDLNDFADTASLIAALDIVVSVDTAIAHLAGALGKPVLLLDRYAGDWRWMRGRADSPWYPTMTIFRQPAPGDWDSVLDEVAAALQPT